MEKSDTFIARDCQNCTYTEWCAPQDLDYCPGPILNLLGQVPENVQSVEECVEMIIKKLEDTHAD